MSQEVRQQLEQRVWRVAAGATPVQSLAELRQQLLVARGVLADHEASFLTPEYATAIHDPFLLADMQAAVDRIFAARDKKQQVVVHGDYDADGVTSTALLLDVLAAIGVHATPFLPDRHGHGYGLHVEVLESLVEQMELMITVDCGITAQEEVMWLKKKSIDTIIVDHHTVPDELPGAVAVIHPNHPANTYPYKWLCGVGTAWKLAQALLRDPRSGHGEDADKEKWLLDLAAIGTIADMVPLLGENRAIVQFGLEVLRRTRRPGLAALAGNGTGVSRLQVRDIGFRIVPRINAAGRMDHPQLALDVLLAKDAAAADVAIARLNALNTERRSATTRILAEAEQLIDPTAPLIFAAHESWHIGVLGLAAGRLSDRYQRPAVVVGGAGAHAIGSARSPDGINIHTVLTQVEQHLERFGGHANAAGFTVAWAAMERFQEALQSAALAGATAVTDDMQVIQADALLAPSVVNRETAELLAQFEPYGEGNTQPQFVLQDVELADWRPVGKSGDHAKFSFVLEGRSVDGIGFGIVESLTAQQVKRGKVDLVGRVEENEYRGRRTLQLGVTEVAPSGTVTVEHQTT